MMNDMSSIESCRARSQLSSVINNFRSYSYFSIITYTILIMKLISIYLRLCTINLKQYIYIYFETLNVPIRVGNNQKKS